MAIPVLSPVMKKVFGTHNERMVKRYLRVVDQVNTFEDQMSTLSDPELRAMSDAFRDRLGKGETAESLMPEVFAAAREAMDRNVGIRNIFNPEHGFDPSKLPADARALHERVQQQLATMEPAQPALGNDFLGCEGPTPPWVFVDIPVRLYDAVREMYPDSKPPFRARPFDVQIIGAMVLYDGRIAEMKTGEGKTIVAPLATYLAVLQGQQVHVVTVNDYLVQRDRDWTFPFFRSLGITVGAIHPMHMQPPQGKQAAYECNVVYGTTSEFGFDYLRDNMKLRVEDQVQKHRDFAIVDEVDSTLIDEARTPLIISGQAHQHAPRYQMADQLARHLVEKQKEWNTADQKVQSAQVEASTIEGDIRNTRDKASIPALKARLDEVRAKLPELEAERDRFTQFYEVELDKKRATLTHDGIAEAQRAAGIGSFYVGDNIDLPHLLEQSIRAHTVYQRDRDYVVAPGEDGKPSVVIVDQNTGRKMVGRQWSDGLHQAVEAKEAVPIKEETQTMATITIQNFFKLYDKLAGMTGTADTEATEFHEIYKLDVVVIPTNVPVVREDRNDLVFISEKDKWQSIVDEIKAFHDVGRPVLVGTTSVEKSEMLSQMLSRKHNIKHEVLNAKQHEREAEIIAGAGKLGAVMIATNMAGRGTDIKLGRITAEELIDHWKRRGICPREVNASMDESAIITACRRHMAIKELELKKADLEAMSDEDVQLALLRHWFREHAWNASGDPDKMNVNQLIEALDNAGNFLLQRLRMFSNIEEMGGLHVVGTERHESRRIDNQLRGRSGRQGDNGSSRFYLSLEDDLMKMFAGPQTLKLLSRLGMKEGDAIDSPMLTKSVSRAQRKVEERNFLWRKNILEYDEVMDHQRHVFYGMRQDVLEGRGIKELIFEDIDESVEDSVETYLDRNYRANCIAEWVREHLNISLDPDRIRGKLTDRGELQQFITVEAKEEASALIRVTIGEYMPNDSDRSEWDLKSLAEWANSNFKAKLTAGELEAMSPREAAERIEEAAHARVDEADLDPLDQFLVANYGPRELAKWVQNKFAIEIDPEEFVKLESLEPAVDKLRQVARDAYRRREISYPIDFALDMTAANLQQNPQHALQGFCDWVRARFELEWEPTALPSGNPSELRQLLIAEAEKWDDSRIGERAERIITNARTPKEIDDWLRGNVRAALTEEQLARAEDDPNMVVEEKLREVMRAELTQFERWVLLQIVDQAWKDHLYEMDKTKESIGFRAFSQKDPRIEFKREGGRLFSEMQKSIRDKVTDLVFKAKLSPQVRRVPAAPQAGAPQPQDAPAPAETQPQGVGAGGDRTGVPAEGAPRPQTPMRRQPAQPAQPAVAAAAAAASVGTAAQQRDIEEASRAGSAQAPARQRPRRAAPTVGRNEPCPCGSGKKFKQCCGARATA